jgi:hypothetical protein
MENNFLVVLSNMLTTYKEYATLLQDVRNPVHKMPQSVIEEITDLITNINEDIVMKLVDSYMLPVCTDEYVHGFLIWNIESKLWEFIITEQGDQLILKEKLQTIVERLLKKIGLENEFHDWWIYSANVITEIIEQTMNIYSDYNFYCRSRLAKMNSNEYLISGTKGLIYQRAGHDGIITYRNRTWNDMYSYEVIDTDEFQKDNSYLMVKMSNAFNSFPKLVELIKALVFKMANHVIIQCSQSVHKFITALLHNMFYDKNSMPFSIYDTIENVMKITQNDEDEEDDDYLMNRKYIHMKRLRFVFNSSPLSKDIVPRLVNEANCYGLPILTICGDASGLESELSVRYDMEDIITEARLSDYINFVRSKQFKTELWKLLLK